MACQSRFNAKSNNMTQIKPRGLARRPVGFQNKNKGEPMAPPFYSQCRTNNYLVTQVLVLFCHRQAGSPLHDALSV